MSAADTVALDARIERGAPATVLALHCSERAWRTAFEELTAKLTPGKRAEHLAVPGGAWGLARAAEIGEGRVKRVLLAGRQPIRDAIESVLAGQSIVNVLLLGHQDCTWYARRFRGLSEGARVREQGVDILSAREALLRWAPARVAASGWVLLVGPDGALSGRKVG